MLSWLKKGRYGGILLLMKQKIRCAVVWVFVLVLFGCAGGGSVKSSGEGNSVQPEYSADSLSLDAAIDKAAAYFTERLPDKAKAAVISFNAPTGLLSDYIIERLWDGLESAQKFVIVDRRNLDRIEGEIKYQLESGKVDDDVMVSMTKQYGAEFLVYGQIIPLGGEYRMTIYATDVEKAVSTQRIFTVQPDKLLASLLNVPAEDAVERAVSVMAQAVHEKTVIAVGRISYADTQTVSGFSAWLKNTLISSAQKYPDKFQVASESESADFAVATRGLTVETPDSGSTIQAVITGNYLPLDNGAEVSLHLISAGKNKPVLASQRFVIPAAELQRRKLLLLPGKDNTAMSLTEFEAKQKVLDPYAGKNNQWQFTVTPAVLDGIYYDGDLMFMTVYSEKQCYFRIVHIDVNGTTQVIYPVAPGDNNFIRAGESRNIPDNTLYKLGPPFGEEIILVAAYDEPFSVNTSSAAAPFSPEIITRSITVDSSSNTPMSPNATAKFSYTILPR